MRTGNLFIAYLLLATATAESSVASTDYCVENTSVQSWSSDDGAVLAEGKSSVCPNTAAEVRRMKSQDVKEWEIHFRSGTWDFRYDSGRMRARAVYSIHSYTHCCAGGYCSQPFERLDELTIWSPDGEVVFDSPLKRRYVNHYSGCRGGADIRIRWFPRKIELVGDAESVSLGGVEVRDILPSYSLSKPSELWSSVSNH